MRRSALLEWFARLVPLARAARIAVDVRVRSTLSTLLLLPAIAAASTAALSRPRHALEGAWSGEGMMLRIDPERAQAKRDPDHPFTWERFEMRYSGGPMVVFMIGETQFIGRLDRDRLVVTRLDSTRSWALQRFDLFVRAP